jgi:glucan endo-1,6-beta-glucosidase
MPCFTRVGDAVLRSTWFTQDDVNILKGAGMNTVRLPVRTFMPLSPMVVLPLFQLGFWIVEPLVNRVTESYPRGGIKFLVGLARVEI